MDRPDAFELFAQYHLGLLPDGTGRFQNLHQIAARYSVSAGESGAELVRLRAGHRQEIDLRLHEPRSQVGQRTRGNCLVDGVYDEYRARLGHPKIRTFDEDEPAW